MTTTPGLIVAPLTPFTANLDVDERALRRQIDYVVKDCGATMVVAAGVETQEYTYLSLDQRKALIRSTIELVDQRVPVMVGVTHLRSKPSRACQFRQDAGRGGGAAAGALRHSQARPRRLTWPYFDAVARETDLPITPISTPGPAPTCRSGYHRARQAPARAAHQGKLARSAWVSR